MLPNELVNHISQYCKTPDFISLRNSCKRFRDMQYYPGREIVIGVKNKTKAELRIGKFSFFALFLTLLYTALLFLIIGIIFLLVDMNNNEVQVITGGTFIAFTIMLIILDGIFLVSTIRIYKTMQYNRITV